MKRFIVDTTKVPFSVKEVEVVEIKDKKVIFKDEFGKIKEVSASNTRTTQNEAMSRLKEIIYIGQYKSRMMNKKTKSWTCRYCGTKMYNRDDVTVDHIKPLSKGGKTVATNLLICCKTCNKSKSSKHKNHYKALLDKSGRRKLNKPSLFHTKIRYVANNKHKKDKIHIAMLDSRIISLNSIRNKENLVDRVMREYNKSRQKFIVEELSNEHN